MGVSIYRVKEPEGVPKYWAYVRRADDAEKAEDAKRAEKADDVERAEQDTEGP